MSTLRLSDWTRRRLIAFAILCVGYIVGTRIAEWLGGFDVAGSFAFIWLVVILVTWICFEVSDYRATKAARR
jgi:uncharacterized membrane protein YoaK (UPF0700 family)